VDNPHAGQQQPHQTQIQVVAGQLVDDPRPVGRQRVQCGKIRRRGSVQRGRIQADTAGPGTGAMPVPLPSAANAWPSTARSPAPCACTWAAKNCSYNVVPERAMPTMKTGAGSVFAARCPDAKRARPNAAMLASMTAR
jgi:hypothetical protein